MNSEEYATLHDAGKTISVRQLKDQTPRTLLWGFTCERESWHLYLAEGMFHLVVYSTPDPHENDLILHQERETLDVTLDKILPDKRLYPEACDFEFCNLLRATGLHLPFTTFNHARETKQFHGEILPFKPGAKVTRFVILVGAAGQVKRENEIFVSEWYVDRQNMLAITDQVRSDFTQARVDKSLGWEIRIGFESGVSSGSVVEEAVSWRDFALERYESLAAAELAAEEITTYCRKLADTNGRKMYVRVHDLDGVDDACKRKVEATFQKALLYCFDNIEAAALAERNFETANEIACCYPSDDPALQTQMEPWLEAVDAAWGAAFAQWEIKPRRDEPWFEVEFC